MRNMSGLHHTSRCREADPLEVAYRRLVCAVVWRAYLDARRHWPLAEWFMDYQAPGLLTAALGPCAGQRLQDWRAAAAQPLHPMYIRALNK